MYNRYNLQKIEQLDLFHCVLHLNTVSESGAILISLSSSAST